MALAAKRSRRLVVDGAVYCWQVRKNSECLVCRGGLGATFVVQREEPQGALLIVDMPQHASPIVPALVTAGIRQALSQGWQPARPGRPFHLGAFPAGVPSGRTPHGQ